MKYNSSRLNNKPITEIKLSKESAAHAERINELFDGGFVSGSLTLNASIEVSNGTETETFDYEMPQYWFEDAEDDRWHDAFLCDVQDDRRIEVLK